MADLRTFYVNNFEEMDGQGLAGLVLDEALALEGAVPVMAYFEDHRRCVVVDVTRTGGLTDAEIVQAASEVGFHLEKKGD